MVILNHAMVRLISSIVPQIQRAIINVGAVPPLTAGANCSMDVTKWVDLGKSKRLFSFTPNSFLLAC